MIDNPDLDVLIIDTNNPYSSLGIQLGHSIARGLLAGLENTDRVRENVKTHNKQRRKVHSRNRR